MDSTSGSRTSPPYRADLCRAAIEIQAVGREAAVGIDAECDRDNALIAEIDRLGHHGDPVLADLRDEAAQVAVEIDTVRWRNDGSSGASLRATVSATAAAPSSARRGTFFLV